MKLFFKRPDTATEEFIETVIDCENYKQVTEQIKDNFTAGRVLMEASNYDTIEMIRAIFSAVPLDRYFLDYLIEQLNEMKKEIKENQDTIDYINKQNTEKIDLLSKKILRIASIAQDALIIMED